MGHIGAQIGVGCQPSVDNHPQFFKAKTRYARFATYRDYQVVIRNGVLARWPRDNQLFTIFKPDRLVPKLDVNALTAQLRFDNCRCLGIFLGQQPVGHFDDGHRTPQTLETLRKFTANRPAAHDDKALGGVCPALHRAPQSLTREITAIFNPGQWRDQRRGPGCNDEAARG